jgi:hypothetical protein
MIPLILELTHGFWNNRELLRNVENVKKKKEEKKSFVALKKTFVVYIGKFYHSPFSRQAAVITCTRLIPATGKRITSRRLLAK